MTRSTSIALWIAVVACAAPSRKAEPPRSAMEAPAPAPASPLEAADPPRTELDRLDAEITARMAELGLERPEPPPTACSGGDCNAQQMSTAAAAATAVDPACKPAGTQVCTETCTLKDAICNNAGRICEIAAQLGGHDAYANDKCNRATASCDAAKQRCCSCM